MIEDRLVEFFKKGMDRGFHTDYLRRALIRKGHSELNVNLAAHKAQIQHTRTSPHGKPRKAPKLREPMNFDMRNFVIGVMIAAIVFLIVLNFFAYSSTSEPEIKIVEKTECPSIDGLETKEKIDQITILSDSITKAQTQIDKQMATIDNLNTTVEDKEQLIDQQLKELKSINEKIKQERKWVKELLMELVNYILSQS
jgi:hypothetical protein